VARRRSSAPERLRRSADIQATFAHGRRWQARLAVAVVRRREAGAPRLAVLAGRRLGKATVRNRAKRRLREVCRGLWRRVCTPADIVILARAGADEAPLAQVSRSVESVLRRAGVLDEAASADAAGLRRSGGLASRADTE
jgi:ribonuclease P protein component